MLTMNCLEVFTREMTMLSMMKLGYKGGWINEDEDVIVHREVASSHNYSQRYLLAGHHRALYLRTTNTHAPSTVLDVFTPKKG